MEDKIATSILYLNGVNVSFDGFKALNNLSLALEDGEMRAIIGPNGAGKTTMMDVVTGKTRPNSGDVLFDGTADLTKLDETQIAELGIGRKFQKPTVFEQHNVLQNLALAAAGNKRVSHTLLKPLSAGQQSRIEEVLLTVGLMEQRHLLAGILSHGQKQWLEIGMLLAQQPRVLLVDEPVAGMTQQETERTAQLLNNLAGEHTVVVVEHDMDFVRSIARRVTVLHEGSVLAEGRMEQVQRDPKVLLVDEPVAGMTHREMDRTAELLLSLAGEHTVVVVEHDMDFVRGIASKVTVLHEGRVLSEGTMDEVQADSKVIEVYLGKEEQH